MAEKGSVIVRLSAAGGTSPVAGAKVTIIYTDENGQTQVEYMTTDASGLTGAVQIPAPAAADSLSPGNGGVAPFAVVTVRAEQPQFESVLVEGVQVFAGKISLQQINMIPLPADPTPQDMLVIKNVPPQNL